MLDKTVAKTCKLSGKLGNGDVEIHHLIQHNTYKYPINDYCTVFNLCLYLQIYWANNKSGRNNVHAKITLRERRLILESL